MVFIKVRPWGLIRRRQEVLPEVMRVRSRPGITGRICRDEQSVVVTVTVME